MNTNEYYAEHDKRFLEYIGIPFPYQRPASQWATEYEKAKIISRSDPHNPYCSEYVKHELIRKEKDAGLIIVPGDEGDYYSKSRFRKTHHVSFKDELRSIFYDLEWMATHWREVKVMIGNHDNRPEKSIAQMFTDQNATDMMILTEQNLLRHLASYFDNVEVVSHRIGGTGIELSYVYQLGDILFTHAEISRMQRTATMERISMQAQRWKRTWMLKPFKVIAQGHNHAAMKVPMDSEWWFSLPTAADPYSLGFEYIYSSRMIGVPPNVGYTVFFQEDGETDVNASDHVILQ